MQDVLQIIGLALIMTIVLAYIRDTYEPFATAASIAFAAIIVAMLIVPLGHLLRLFEQIASGAGVGRTYLNILLRAVGIAYLASFGARVSKDAGEDTLAVVVELAGKVLILVLAMPVVVSIVQSLAQLLSW